MKNLIEIGQIVKLKTNDEWNGLYGIIDKIENDFAHIFCVNKPCWIYYIDLQKTEDLKKIMLDN